MGKKDGDGDSEEKEDEEFNDSSPYCENDCPEHDSHIFKCNICGNEAEFVVQLELVKERSNYNIMESVNQMPFYLCNAHEYLYKKMQNNIDLKDYFTETIKENR